MRSNGLRFGNKNENVSAKHLYSSVRKLHQNDQTTVSSFLWLDDFNYINRKYHFRSSISIWERLIS